VCVCLYVCIVNGLPCECSRISHITRHSWSQIHFTNRFFFPMNTGHFWQKKALHSKLYRALFYQKCLVFIGKKKIYLWNICDFKNAAWYEKFLNPRTEDRFGGRELYIGVPVRAQGLCGWVMQNSISQRHGLWYILFAYWYSVKIYSICILILFQKAQPFLCSIRLLLFYQNIFYLHFDILSKVSGFFDSILSKGTAAW